MEPERWQKIERLCYSALNEEKSARAAFLEQACAGDEALRRAVELLLAQHEKDDNFLEVPAMEVAARGLARDQHDTSGLASLAPSTEAADLASVEKISFGPYRLIQKLGEGGMGEVWLAEQSKPVRRRVALKLIKVGMDTREVVARFDSERQALALMDHPAIAKVFDAGSTPEGRPYFVMEYVAGIPITAYCDKHKLTTRQRMELFIQVCDGVQHAHQKAIIHRDLKPSNILISEVDGKPMPKIIDFGLAKATSQRLTDGSMYTRVGTLLGTLEYMSPEQADSAGEDIDTRTDVYSLGVVLYQLLVGALPLDLKKLAYDEMLRRLRDTDVPKPSSRILAQGGDSAIAAKNRGTDAPSLTRQLRGDPDAVVLKALEKDRKRRYASPSELAADLGRYLRNEPVSAHTPSAAYRTRKYIRRHRLGVAVATGLLAILPAFAVVQRVQLQRTRLERDRANRERDRATRITDFMTGMFQVSDPNEQRGNSVTAREILDKASNDIRTGMTKDPDAQAQMMQVMGDVYNSLGLFSRARDLDQQSLDIRRRLLGPRTSGHTEFDEQFGGCIESRRPLRRGGEVEPGNARDPPPCPRAETCGHTEFDEQFGGCAVGRRPLRRSREGGSGNARPPPPRPRAGTPGHNKFDEQPGGLSHLLGALSRSGEVGSGNARPPPPGVGAGTSADPEFDEQPGGCSVG